MSQTTESTDVSASAQKLYQEIDLVGFLNEYHSEELNELAKDDSKRDLWIDETDLLRFNPELVDILHGEFDSYSVADLRTAFAQVVPEADTVFGNDLKPQDVTIRFYGFTQADILDVGDYWADEHLGEYIAVKGQISKSTKKRPMFTRRVFVCNGCGFPNVVPQPHGEYQEAYECQQCGSNPGFTEVPDHDDAAAIDYKRLRLETPPDERESESSDELDVEVSGDLLKWLDKQHIDAGTRVVVYGTFKTEERNDSDDYILDAKAIETQDNDLDNLDPDPEEEEKIEAYAAGEHGDPYELLAESVAPSIMGVETVDDVEYRGEEKPKMWWFKLGSALAGLFQGFRKQANGDPYRGTSHVLAVGDPSTGKSTVLDWVGDVSPRSASTSGKGATAAGLTAAAVQDNLGDGNRWTLEAGVLVQANGGVAVVDELDKMDKEAVSSMHGALERQRVDVSKAGINATLRAETALLAAGNPKDSRFTQYGDKHEEIDLVGSLLDRFDLIFIIEDAHYEERDREIGGHIVESWTEGAKIETGEVSAEESGIASPIDTDLLKKWVALSRKVKPRITDDAVEERFSEFYVSIRSVNDDMQTDGTDPIPATTRSLEGVLRLAEAVARVELSETIEMHHAEIAISLVKASLNDIGYDEETGQYDIDRLTDGKSASQRDIDARLRGVISELETTESGADREDVISALTESGDDRERVTHRLDKLYERGEVYEPSRGELRTT